MSGSQGSLDLQMVIISPYRSPTSSTISFQARNPLPLTAMSGLAFNRSIVRQRSRHAAAIASSVHSSHSIHSRLNVRPYSAKHAPSDREPTAFASEAYHEREVPGRPFRVDRYLRDPNPATTETPIDLTPEQRKIIERTLRVDLVGEGGANWIYQATKFVADLKGDKETSKKVEVSRPCVLAVLTPSYVSFSSRNVVDRTPSPSHALHFAETASSSTHLALSIMESRFAYGRSGHGHDGSARHHGMHRSRRDRYR